MPAFPQILQADRARFNAQFAAARGQYPRLDGDEWLLILREMVAPIVEASSQQIPERAPEVGAALYEAGLELLGRDLLGPRARHPLINAGWRLLLPSLATQLNQNPRRTIALVSNALHTLAAQPSARPANWIERMQAVAPHCADVEILANAGFVAAWRCGLAHYRARAVELLSQLPPEIGATVAHRWDTAENWIATRERIVHDAWFDPDQAEDAPRTLRVKWIVGAFTGFGGVFTRPPQVVRRDRRFWAGDGHGWFLLNADAFGATLQSVGAVAPGAADEHATEFQLKSNGKVLWGDQSAQFPQLANASSSAADQSTLMATIPLSHSVYVVACTSK